MSVHLNLRSLKKAMVPMATFTKESRSSVAELASGTSSAGHVLASLWLEPLVS